jgi:bacterioferritin-associated ferredoxin
MYICLCYGVTENEIREAVQDGACSLSELRQQLGVSAACGKCTDCALDVLKQALNSISQEQSLTCTLNVA